MYDPLYALRPVADIGSQYADTCSRYFDSLPVRAGEADSPPGSASSSGGSAPVDVDDLLLQVMPDRDKVGRLARLTGTLRYAVDGGDTRQVEDTVGEMEQIGRHLSDKYRPAELIAAARSSEP